MLILLARVSLEISFDAQKSLIVSLSWMYTCWFSIACFCHPISKVHMHECTVNTQTLGFLLFFTTFLVSLLYWSTPLTEPTWQKRLNSFSSLWCCSNSMAIFYPHSLDILQAHSSKSKGFKVLKPRTRKNDSVDYLNTWHSVVPKFPEQVESLSLACQVSLFAVVIFFLIFLNTLKVHFSSIHSIVGNLAWSLQKLTILISLWLQTIPSFQNLKLL